MDQYPFGNFRDNPPWPVCLPNQAPCFSYEVQDPNIPCVIPPSFHPNQMDYSYVHYNAVPILVPANPFTNNFSFPPPPSTRIPGPADIRLPRRPFNPLLVPNPNEYVMLQTHTLVGSNVTDAQFNTSQLKKQRKVQDERRTLQQDQFISEVKSTQYANTIVPICKDHGDVYSLQQKQYNEQQQITQQTVQTLSDQLEQQARLSGPLATVKHEHSATRATVKHEHAVTLGMNSASTGDSATKRYQTINKDVNHVVRPEEIDFPPKQAVITGENVLLLNPPVSQTTRTVNVNERSEIYEHPGVILTQATSQEQENRSVKQQLPDIQEELHLNKQQDEHHAQLHQHNTNPVNSKQVQFNKDKKDKPRVQNNIQRNNSERHNTEHNRTQPWLQHRETPHWQYNNNWPPRYRFNKTQTGRQQFQQTHQYTPRVNTDIRYSRTGNQHSKDSEAGCSKERTDKDQQEGIKHHRVADFNYIGSRCYRNRRFTSAT